MSISFDNGNRYLLVTDGDRLRREAVEADLEACGFVRASRLAAAEAMVEDARNLARSVLENRMEWPEGVWHKWAKRILASRPSECGYLIRDGQTTIGDCQREPGHEGEHQRRPSEQASKEDSEACEEIADLVDGQVRQHQRIRELETQLAEAKVDLSAIHDELEQWGFWKPSGDVMSVKQLINAYCGLDAKLEAAEASLAEVKESRRLERVAKADAEIALSECQSRLEAAEAEREHLLDGCALLRVRLGSLRAMHMSSPDLEQWDKADQSRAAAATEEPKPAAALCIHCLKPVHEGRCGLPNPRGADYIHRHELTALLRSLGATEVAKQCETGVFGPVGKNA